MPRKAGTPAAGAEPSRRIAVPAGQGHDVGCTASYPWLAKQAQARIRRAGFGVIGPLGAAPPSRVKPRRGDFARPGARGAPGRAVGIRRAVRSDAARPPAFGKRLGLRDQGRRLSRPGSPPCLSGDGLLSPGSGLDGTVPPDRGWCPRWCWADGVAARNLPDRFPGLLAFQHLAPLVQRQLMRSAESLTARLGAGATSLMRARISSCSNSARPPSTVYPTLGSHKVR